MSKTIIGLSLGNTSSSIAFVKDGKVEVIANQDGERAIPSMLAYAHGDEYYGGQAKQQLIRNPRNTVAQFRDFLGHPFSKIDPSACHNSAHPVEGANGAASFEVTQGDDKLTLSVDDAVVRLLGQLHNSARDYIGKDIDGTVLAVPSDFSEAQRKLITELATKAGLPVLQVINEPSAALLAHVSRSDLLKELGDKIFVVADFGGSRSDGAVIAYNGGILTILATLHDPELGGRSIDAAIVELLAKEFEKQHSVDPRKNERAMAKLTHEAELIKKTLSNSTTTQYGIESVAEGFDFSGSLNRLRFEMAARPVFARMGEFVQTLVKKAGLDVLDVDDVLLVGGSSWIPKVAATIGAVFDEDRTTIWSPSNDSKAIDPDELIARGAAIQGSLIGNFDTEEIVESLQPVVVNGPHLAKPIGIKLADGTAQEVLAQNTLVPVRKSVTLDAEGKFLLELVEIDREIKVELQKPAPPPADGSDSEWSDDEDEEIEVRTQINKAGKTLAQLAVTANGKLEVVLNITRELKLQVVARSADQVSGTI